MSIDLRLRDPEVCHHLTDKRLGYTEVMYVGQNHILYYHSTNTWSQDWLADSKVPILNHSSALNCFDEFASTMPDLQPFVSEIYRRPVSKGQGPINLTDAYHQNANLITSWIKYGVSMTDQLFTCRKTTDKVKSKLKDSLVERKWEEESLSNKMNV